jgi:hypothetical protein
MNNSLTPGHRALSAFTLQNDKLKESPRGNKVRVYRHAPSVAILQLLHDSGKRITGVNVELSADELKALRAMIDATLSDIS